ncbi:MAG TPA: hypothetical protein VH251_05420 [Verrucomicrobiae bacterium]|nr:hypothetical protein [Verrucomicrobiae bacterium]
MRPLTKSMKRFFICAFFLGQITAWAQAPLILTADAKTRGTAIPHDFIGLSFETSNLLPGTNGAHLFSAENKTLINLFRNTGIKNLRVGGGTVDIPRYAVPGQADIDSLFAFAKAVDAKVIYSFRLLNGDKTNAAVLARYICQNYPSQLDAFAIGNEPDWKSYHNQDPKITNYPSYLADWRDFAQTIIASAPGARFSGPDTGANYPVPGARDTRYDGKGWTQRFADDEKNSGILAMVLQHDYVGQGARGVSISSAIDAMLSTNWVEGNYPALYRSVLAHAAEDGLKYRMTECNDYTGGVKDASDAFVAALWALDYMHWWAAHDCAGVNFHNRRGTLTDTIAWDSAAEFRINPKACGLRAFEIGSHGDMITSLRLTNPARVNVDCYAVGDATNLFVTIVNKTCGSTGTNVAVTIQPEHFTAMAGECMRLEGIPASEPLAKVAVLGGSRITGDTEWAGTWTPLSVTKSGQCVVAVPPTSAAIVHLKQHQIN